MNENEITQNNQDNEEEISLIDLFAVLIRHRMLIVLGTVIVTFVAGLYLFVAPKFIKKLDDKSVTVSYSVKVNTIPSAIQDKLAVSTPGSVAKYYAGRIQFLVDEFKAFPVFTDEDSQMSEFEFNKFVQDLLTQKKYQIQNVGLGNDFDITMKIPLAKLEVSNALVKDIVSKIEIELDESFAPLIDDLAENTEKSIEKAVAMASTTTDMSALQNLESLSVEIEHYKATQTNFLELKETPFVIPEAQGRAKKLIIVCFAAFFIFVLVAFLLNAIQNIKADPEASKVISDAWNSGKHSKK